MQPSFQCCGVTEDHGWKVWEKVSPTLKLKDESESGESGRTCGKANAGFMKISFFLSVIELKPTFRQAVLGVGHLKYRKNL